MNFLPHQIIVLDKARPILKKHGVVVLALACRLGKSFMALQLASELTDQGLAREILVVTKKKAIGSIQSDAKELGVRCVVTNYEALHKYTGRPAVVVLDEFPVLSAVGKPSKTTRAVRAIGGDYHIMLSATPAIESSSQWFHSFWATGKGPWKEYKSFYQWFSNYGVPSPVRVAGGILRETYKKVLDTVAGEVKPFCVTMTQAEAGFAVEAEVVVHSIDDGGAAAAFYKQLRNDGLVRFGSHVVVAENPAALHQKAAMYAGGTLIEADEVGGDEGVPFETGKTTKLDYLASKLKHGVPVAIFTNFIHERQLIIRFMSERGWKCGEDIEAFKAGEISMFVGSITSYSKGVDMSWHVGIFIIYSLTFSGEVFYQIKQRMNKYTRVDPIKVHVLTIKNSIETKILAAVSAKQNFNEKFIRGSGSRI